MTIFLLSSLAGSVVRHSLGSHHLSSSVFSVSTSLARLLAPCDVRGFLQAPVILRSWYLTDTYYTYTRQEFGDGNLSVWNCEFHDFDVRDDGGALKVGRQLDLFNVHFQNCTAKNGGALFGCSSIRCIFTTFTQISSRNGSGLYQIGQTPLSIDSSLFSLLEAHVAAGFYKLCGPAHLNGTNFTRMVSKENCARFESDGGELSGLFLMCQMWYARKMNSGIVLNGHARIKIESCVFEKCRDKGDSSSVMFATGIQFCTIQRCSFQVCEGGYNIAFKNERRVIVADCCFSTSKEKAIQEGSGSVRQTNCRFGCTAATFIANGDAGFRTGRPPTYRGCAAQTRPPVWVWVRRTMFVWVGLVLTMVGEAVAVVIAHGIKQKCHRRKDKGVL